MRVARGGPHPLTIPSLAAPLPCAPQFPYPILNKLPFPSGFAGFVVLGFAVVLGTFQLGKAVKGALGALGSGASSGGGGAVPLAAGGGGSSRRGSRGTGGGGKKEQ